MPWRRSGAIVATEYAEWFQTSWRSNAMTESTLERGLIVGFRLLMGWTFLYAAIHQICLLYTSPSPRDRQKSRMPSSA